ncbi:MAG: Dps family protein [Metamycoplasmataceae bacterium]
MKNIEKLKILQSSLIVFTNKVYSIHWNMKGKEFFSLHQATEDLFKDFSEFFDSIAEKIVMHGQLSVGTLKESLELSKIKEIPVKEFEAKELSEIIVKDLTTIIDLCDDVEGTNVIQPLLDEIYASSDKWRWKFAKTAK